MTNPVPLHFLHGLFLPNAALYQLILVPMQAGHFWVCFEVMFLESPISGNFHFIVYWSWAFMASESAFLVFPSGLVVL